MKSIQAGIIKFVFILSLCLLFSSVQAQEEKQELVFGVHSYLPATDLLERFSPLIEYLEKKIAADIHIKVSNSYQDHIDNLEHGLYDFAYIGPASFITLTMNNRDYPLLGRLSFFGKDTFRGAIIIRQDSQIKSLQDFKDNTFAFGDPESTLSSKVPKRMLEDAGVSIADLKHHSHLKNHHNVALAVLMGKYDGGGVKQEVFNKYQSKGLKVLQWTQDFPTHIFVASRSMNPVLLEQIKKLLYGIKHEANADKILQSIKKGTTAIIPAQIEEYEQLRQYITPKSPVQQSY